MEPFRETIVAVSTAPGRGAVALVRVSGPDAFSLVERHFRSHSNSLPGHREVRPGRFLDATGCLLDRVLVTCFQAPSSYTGDHLVEISCHGSPPVVESLLSSLLESGARLAEPGEFSLRAFLNGKMDLAQAEAVRDLIESRTEYQARLATEQLEGSLSAALRPLKEELVRAVSHLEAAVEFVEDDVEPETRERLLENLRKVDRELAGFQESFAWGRVVREGVQMAVIGKPNAGKSSIFNWLLEYERAIVSPTPGTTRDALAETISLGGVPARLVDTAGIRASDDPIESLGVGKSLEAIRDSQGLLWVLDHSRDFDEEDRRIVGELRATPYLLVINKSDLPGRLQVPPDLASRSRGQVPVSALQRVGLVELRGAIQQLVAPARGALRESVVLTSRRHHECVQQARRRLGAAVAALESGLSEEFALYDLQGSLRALGEITGETDVEDILERIFSTFCIGK